MADITKLEKELWEAADDLRANSKLTSQQYCMPVLGLIFLRYAWGRFKRADARIQEERSKKTGRQAPVSPEDYAAKGAMWLPEESRYDYLLMLPETADASKVVNRAIEGDHGPIETSPVCFPQTYTDLGNELLHNVLRIFNNPQLDEESDDIIGRIYEYFLGKFAPSVAERRQGILHSQVPCPHDHERHRARTRDDARPRLRIRRHVRERRGLRCAKWQQPHRLP